MANIPIGANSNLHMNPASRVMGLSHQVNFVDTNTHHLAGQGSVAHQFTPQGPTTVGLGGTYTHVPTGSNLSVSGSHTSRGGGDSISAAGMLNLHQSANARVDAFGNYSKHIPSGITSSGGGVAFGTPAGTALTAGVQHTNKGFGTVGNVGANLNLYSAKNTSLDAYSQCSKHLSSGMPANCTSGIKFSKKF